MDAAALAYRMAQAHLAGKERSFARFIGFSILTLGFYFPYWLYTSYKELLTQFGQAGDYPTGKFILALIPLVNIVGIPLYVGDYISDLNGMRGHLGLPQNRSLKEFLLWYFVGSLILIGPLVAWYRIISSVNEVWRTLEAQQGQNQGPPQQPQQQASAPTAR